MIEPRSKEKTAGTVDAGSLFTAFLTDEWYLAVRLRQQQPLSRNGGDGWRFP